MYPSEIEAVLPGHPDVADVAVDGVADPDRGQRPIAVVQPGECVVPGPELAMTLESYCREYVAGCGVPRIFGFDDKPPGGPAGKLLRRIMREAYRDPIAGLASVAALMSPREASHA
jgi:long-chain acyl-CoA synthetase